MRRAPFFASLCLSLILLPATLHAQNGAPIARRHAVSESKDAPAEPVQIVPTSLPEGSSSIEIGSDHWLARGYDLRSLVAEVFNLDARRIDFADAALASQRLDVSVALPDDAEDDAMRSLVVAALEQRFGIHIAPEDRTMDVYVLTAPNGPGVAMKRHVTKMSAAEIVGMEDIDDAGSLSRVTVFGRDCTDKAAENGILVEASTVADFERTLEPDLDRVLLDETHLDGSFDFAVSKYANQNELFERLHDELGLVVTPAERSVSVLTVRNTDEKEQRAQSAPSNSPDQRL